jgi:hypothetical protein
MRTDPPKPGLKERLVLRLLCVKVSDDGTRWLASRKRQATVERAFQRVVDRAWIDGTPVELSRDSDGMTIKAPGRTIQLRWEN